jgi:hypothetical protein
MSFSTGSSDSNSNASTNQTSFQRSVGTGTTSGSSTPINSGQIQGALNLAQGAATGGNPFVNAGQNSIYGQATQDSNLYGAGYRTMGNTLNGSYLSAGNPYFQHMADQVSAAVRPNVDTSFEGAGRYGSGLAARAQAGAVSDAIGNLAYQNYGQERQNQVAATSQLPSYVAGSLQPGQALMSAGASPILQYISALGSVSPGTTSNTTTTKDVSAASVGSGTQQGSSSGSNSNFGLNLK